MELHHPTVLKTGTYFVAGPEATRTALTKGPPALYQGPKNYVTSAPVEAAPDSIGELWFDDAAAMDHAMNSPEMVAGFEDAKQFADLDRTLGLTDDG